MANEISFETAVNLIKAANATRQAARNEALDKAAKALFVYQRGWDHRRKDGAILAIREAIREAQD